MSGLPARADATDHNHVSTASGVGPLCARAWTGHVIEEVAKADLVRLPDNGPVPPGGAWCVHTRRQGILPAAMRWSRRPSHALGLDRVLSIRPCGRGSSSSETDQKGPRLQTIAIAATV